MMRACGVSQFGDEVMSLTLSDPPGPNRAQIVMAVEAAGVGGWDRLVGTGAWNVGLRPPAALGVEGFGRVVGVGEGVADFQLGDAVLTHDAPLPGGSGFWSERVLVSSTSLAPCPMGLEPNMAGALPVAGLTARQSLDDVALEPGQALLVTGGASPTGSLVVQLAALAGIAVTATASAGNTERLMALGAHHVVDYHDMDWPKRTGAPFDGAVVVAPGTSEDALALLRDEGRLCSLTSDAPQGERGIASHDLYVQPNSAQLANLAVMMRDGLLAFDLETVSLSEGSTAFDLVAKGRAGGKKFVLRP